MKKIILSILLYCTVMLASAQEIKIVDKHITFDSTRVRLSIEYLKERHGITQTTPTIQPKIIVLHWTAATTFSSTFNAFNPPKLPNGDRKDIAKVSSLNTSSQFLIDRNGAIYRLMPENYFARHVIGLNYCAIGVENVGSANFPLTAAQLKANEMLVRYLYKKYNIEYLIGHYEYSKFKGTALWKETNPNYLTIKNDPGIDFMSKMRANVKDLALKGAPNN
ncbi:peptidoglycan recognition protein family protein [Pedobacter sp.]